jgi:hypothetical protein
MPTGAGSPQTFDLLDQTCDWMTIVQNAGAKPVQARCAMLVR